jgi:predicted O-methyltransferase YrrM
MARNCMDNNATIYSLDNDETALNKLYQFGKINNYNNIFIARQNCVHSHSYIGDVALALALTHHLSLGQSYPFDFIAKQLASFTTNVLITEFMPRGLATGTQPDMNLPEYYKLENFVHELEQHFNKVEVFDYDVPDGTSPRILLVCYEKKGTKNNYAEDITSKIADIKPQTQQKNFKENSNIVINSNYQYYNSFLDINNQWYEPVLGGADTLKNFLFNRNVYEGVSNILSMLEQDEYSKFIRGYIEKGIGRYGNNWQYADICTVLYALSQKLKIRNYLEIGVRTGRSMSMVVANNPDINIVGFDMWQQDYAGMRNPGPSFVKNELMKFGFIGAAEFVSGNSHETLKKYFDEHSDEYFDIITVDGDHSEHGAIEDITDVLPHISIGGIIVFDDIAHPQHKYLKNVWENTVCSKDNFSTFEFTDIGYGVAFAVRKY